MSNVVPEGQDHVNTVTLPGVPIVIQSDQAERAGGTMTDLPPNAVPKDPDTHDAGSVPLEVPGGLNHSNTVAEVEEDTTAVE
jgi:hypothetical protein